MTFAYVGYVWSLLGCALVLIFFGSIGATLYAIGKRRTRRGQDDRIEVVSLEVRRPQQGDDEAK